MDPAIAFDIETIPLPFDTLEPFQEERLDRLTAKLMDREPDVPIDRLRIKAASLDPMLGRVVCVSFAEYPGETWSVLARTLAEERRLLETFWRTAILHPGRLWVSFNGKAFDLPFLIARSMYHEITLEIGQILNLNPYSHFPHLDLATALRTNGGLEAFCRFLGIRNPKAELGGEHVAEAALEGRWEEIQRYCEADVQATLSLYLRARPFIWDGPAYPKAKRSYPKPATV